MSPGNHDALSAADAEQKLRAELANLYHLVDYHGWSEMVFNHISLRLPGPKHHYLVNPLGLTYDEITPENLIKLDIDGNPVEPCPYPANPAGFALHGVIHEHRPDIRCIAHMHTIAISAIAGKKNGLSHDNFHGAQLTGRVGYHDFEGITIYQDERERILASLGSHNVLILRNHGVAVCGPDVASTFALMVTVQRAAEIQYATESMAGENMQISPEVRERCERDGRRGLYESKVAVVMYEAIVRRMKREKAAAGYALSLGQKV